MSTHDTAGSGATTSTRAMADEALRELVEVASQVEAVAIVERSAAAGDQPLAAVFGGSSSDGPRATRLGELAHRLLDQAEVSRAELGREPIVQCEVATGTGHVFVVASGDHAIIAVTSAEPTVGLVFYDLKTALRALRDSGHVTAIEPSTNGSKAASDSASPAATRSDVSGSAATDADDDAAREGDA